jgi:hypothetical protein
MGRNRERARVTRRAIQEAYRLRQKEARDAPVLPSPSSIEEARIRAALDAEKRRIQWERYRSDDLVMRGRIMQATYLRLLAEDRRDKERAEEERMSLHDYRWRLQCERQRLLTLLQVHRVVLRERAREEWERAGCPRRHVSPLFAVLALAMATGGGRW